MRPKIHLQATSAWSGPTLEDLGLKATEGRVGHRVVKRAFDASHAAQHAASHHVLAERRSRVLLGFTSTVFTSVLKEDRIKIRLDGKDRRIDNAFIERLWRSLENEDVCLHAYSDRSAVSGRYMACYGLQRWHARPDQ